MKRWWQSRTVWFGSFLVAFGAMVEYVDANSSLLTPYFGKWGGAFTMAVGLLNVLLRLRTSAAIVGASKARQ